VAGVELVILVAFMIIGLVTFMVIGLLAVR
jgi:hypothetical protein